LGAACRKVIVSGTVAIFTPLTYIAQLRERLLNPFLEHRLADIAQNHALKKQRRIAPLLELADSITRDKGVRIAQPHLTEMVFR
jgi:tagaturonate reductase